jgi:hypothetical protein
MHITEAYRLKPGSPVWIWIVQLAHGRWWPGIVDTVQVIHDKPRIVVRFECRATRARLYYPMVSAGIATTAMRYLEDRDPNIKGIDEPHFVPASLLERPEELELVVPQLGAVSTDRQRKENQRREAARVHKQTKILRSNMTLDEG